MQPTNDHEHEVPYISTVSTSRETDRFTRNSIEDGVYVAAY